MSSDLADFILDFLHLFLYLFYLIFFVFFWGGGGHFKTYFLTSKICINKYETDKSPPFCVLISEK